MSVRCKHFAKTKIKLPLRHTIADECRICPLRNKKGDCVEDITDDLGLTVKDKLDERDEIWRRFYESKNTKRV